MEHPAAQSAAVAAIRLRRAESNRAIAERDAARVVSVMLSDVTVAVANGPVLQGQEASRRAFAEQFAERSFLGYVREPIDIVVQDPPTRAIEEGRWTGRWRAAMGERAVRGTYRAEWRLTEFGWMIAAETFTPA